MPGLGAPASLLVPARAARTADQTRWVVAVTVPTAVAIVGLLVAPASAPVLWALLYGLGTGAAFPLAMVDRPLFAGWMKSMVERPGMLGPYGIGESYGEDGTSAPLLTWDGKALPMIAWMGGVSADIGRQLRRDGRYDAFMKRVRDDYRLFDPRTNTGEDVPFHAPPPARQLR